MISNSRTTAGSPIRKRGLLILAASSMSIMASFASFHTVEASENNLPVDARPLNVPLGPDRAMEMSTGDATPNPAPAGEATATSPGILAPIPKPILRILFDNNAATLSDEARTEISDFVEQFKIKGGRVTLKGYAGTPGSSSSNDRRLSLRRVLAVREAILAQGIDAERLEVRALGGVKDAGPQDRVDILKPGR